MDTTVVAAATPLSPAALTVLRLSGPQALSIADAVFRTRSGKGLSAMPGYRAAYGDFYEGDTHLDEGIALVLRAPKSYTGEDMAELSCHGSPSIAARILAACVAKGAVPAAAGEFTRRAFENGKLDLAQAEAVCELIESEGQAAAGAALARREGLLSRKINGIADGLALAAAALAVWGDYPEEEDAPAVTREALAESLEGQRRLLGELIDGYRSGQLIQKGITVAIAGIPNAGKSTLLNLLAGENRAIVTEIPGTTRDIVEAQVELEGMALRILDTAGIRETKDAVEKIGVERARAAMEQADLVLLVLDRTCPFEGAQRAIWEDAQKRPCLILENKGDLLPVGEPPGLRPAADLVISAASGEGTEPLAQAILEKLGITLSQDHCLIASARQYACIGRAKAALEEALAALHSGVTLDAVGILIDDAIAPLAELLGTSVSDAVLTQVFSHFCVGK